MARLRRALSASTSSHLWATRLGATLLASVLLFGSSWARAADAVKHHGQETSQGQDGVDAAVQSQMAELVRSSLTDFFVKAALPAPRHVNVQATATFAETDGQKALSRLGLDVSFASDQAPEVIREARQALLRTLRANGYRTDADSPTAGAPLPMAVLSLSVEPLRSSASQNDWRHYAAFAGLTAMSLFFLVLGLYMLTWPLRALSSGAKQKRALAQSKQQDARAAKLAKKAAVKRPAPSDRPEPALNLPAVAAARPQVTANVIATTAKASTQVPSAALSAKQPAPTATVERPSAPAPVTPSPASVTRSPAPAFAALLNRPAVAPPKAGDAAPAYKPLTTAPTSASIPAPAQAPVPSLPQEQSLAGLRRAIAERSKMPPAASQSGTRATPSPGGATTAKPKVDIAKRLAEASEPALRKAFEQLPFDKALAVLSRLDRPTRSSVLGKLAIGEPLRINLERELARIPPPGAKVD